MLGDQDGEAIIPVVHGGRELRDAAMPPIPLPDDEITAIATYIHSVMAKSPG